MLANLYKVDKLKERVDETIKYFSPIGVGWFYTKVIIIIGINMKPLSSMLSYHERFEICEGFQNDEGCAMLCAQRYAPISLKDFWNFQIFITLLPFVFFQSFTKKHIERNSAQIDTPYPSLSKFKMKVRAVKLRIEKFAEDRTIRLTKLLTLFTQLILEVVSFIVIVELQRRRYNFTRDDVWGLSWNLYVSMIVVVPEEYRCPTEAIEANSFFGMDWYSEFGGLKPCINAGRKGTCWTHRSVESSFIQGFLVALLVLGILTNFGEILYIFLRSFKPAVRLTKKLSSNVQFMAKPDSPSAEKIYTEQMIKHEIRKSNYNLNRKDLYDTKDANQNNMSSPYFIKKRTTTVSGIIEK